MYDFDWSRKIKSGEQAEIAVPYHTPINRLTQERKTVNYVDLTRVTHSAKMKSDKVSDLKD